MPTDHHFLHLNPSFSSSYPFDPSLIQLKLAMEDDPKSKHTCKFCNKAFPCGRSLGGHMRSHLISISPTQKKLPPLTKSNLSPEDGGAHLGYTLREKPRKSSHKTEEESTLLEDNKSCKADEEDSWSDHHHKPNSSSDNEAALWRKKRSERPKRYTNSSCLNLSPFEQEEQEEVALSLILLSMDCISSVVDSHNTFSESANTSTSTADHCLKFKKLNTEFRASRKRLKSSEKFGEVEVNSPKNLMIKKNGSNPFGSDLNKKSKSSKKINSNSSEMKVSLEYKFSCIICKKGFSSYQALGGHRASHKKFKGCCAPTSDEFQEKIEECKKSKDHECPICFKVFPSGQALGGHKRSHLITDQASNTDQQIPEIRGFLDLNLPAPVEEDCSEFKPWWIGTSLGLLSSS